MAISVTRSVWHEDQAEIIRARFRRDCELSKVACEIAALLERARQLAADGQASIDQIERRRIMDLAERTVRRMAPGAEARARANAYQALEAVIQVAITDLMADEDHSCRHLIQEGMDDLKRETLRTGAVAVLAAFEGSLEVRA